MRDFADGLTCRTDGGSGRLASAETIAAAKIGNPTTNERMYRRKGVQHCGGDSQESLAVIMDSTAGHPEVGMNRKQGLFGALFKFAIR
jgi:hypothetical protein